MIEINWGHPITFLSSDGDIERFATIEKAYYWLRKKWPVADHDRDIALGQIDAAMHCLAPVSTARRAFIKAAKTAGFEPAQTDSDLTAAF